MLLEFPDDPRLAGVYDQVMLGEQLMIAPVVEPGATQRHIILPVGTWHDFWSEQSWEITTSSGAVITYPVPLERLPLLVRGGTILPMSPAQEGMVYIPDDHQFAHLQLNLWPPYPAVGTLYDDDGCSRAYLRGECELTRFFAEQNVNCLDVHIAATEGDFPGQVESRQIELVVHRCSQPQRVNMNGSLLAGWVYETQQKQLTIPLVCPLHQETIVQIEK